MGIMANFAAFVKAARGEKGVVKPGNSAPPEAIDRKGKKKYDANKGFAED